MDSNKKLTLGILAHVDAGKTTLSEALLYTAKAIRKMGRVDHGDTFLDCDAQEKERGITIFAGQAVFEFPADDASNRNTDVVLLDTPGHVDFSAEMERTLGVLDYAVLVISGKDGVQGHTLTLWKLLRRHNIPTFIFVNKMDMDGADRAGVMTELKQRVSQGCIDILGDGENQKGKAEEIALTDEILLDEFLETATVSNQSIANAIKACSLFPCYFGSALKLEGVEEFMHGIKTLTFGYGEQGFDDVSKMEADKKEALKIRVFRISHSERGERITHIKILSGILRVKDEINGEKVDQIRIYSGTKFSLVDEATAGMICAVTGLAESKIEGNFASDPIMTYNAVLPRGSNIHDAYLKLKRLEEEDPTLHVAWDEQTGEIHVRLMGEVQKEVLCNIINERFDMNITFDSGSIAYRETITSPVEGAGHYEPLRHYAEVHLLLEPMPEGSGLSFESSISEDVLDRNWQRLIMTHLAEREHIGALTGSPVTDIKITLLSGKAHDKHTEGGDFRQATYRAVRQALRKSLARGEAVLLEPWYDFELYIPDNSVGRAMSDIKRMGGTSGIPQSCGEGTCIKGSVPVSEVQDYAVEVASYTRGYGHIVCTPSGYRPCHDQEDEIENIGYDADKDAANTGDSVFCFHGAGHSVPWNEADEMMHVKIDRRTRENGDGIFESRISSAAAGVGREDAEDKELQRIFDKTFKNSKEKRTSIEAREFDSELVRRRKAEERRRKAESEKLRNEMNMQEYLIVDGYNIIFAWDELKELAKVNIDGAREALIEILGNYKGYKRCRVMVVFDAYKVKGGQRRCEIQNGVTVVYTKETETADTYIERSTFELSKKGSDEDRRKYRVRVATSDRLEQMIVTGNDATKVSAEEFKDEIEQVNAEINEFIKKLAQKNKAENPNKLRIPQKD